MADFYVRLFNWTIDADNHLGYRRVSSDQATGIRRGIWPAPQADRNFVQLFIAVDDVRKYYEQATGRGARSIVAPQNLPDGDELAILLDPFGMAFGIIRKGGADAASA